MPRMILFVFSICFLCASPVFQCAAQMAPDTRKVIDGAVNPQAIPDEAAWLMLFTTIADSPNAPAYNVRVGFLTQGKFDKVADKAGIDQIMAAANEAMARIHAMETTVFASALDTDARTQSLRSQRDTIIRDVVAALLLRVPPGIANKFQAHIAENVKPHIRIIR